MRKNSIFINKQVDIYRQASLRICNPLSKNVRPLKPGICNPHVFRHLGSTDLRHLRNQLIDFSLSFCKFFCDICFSFYDIICLFYDMKQHKLLAIIIPIVVGLVLGVAGVLGLRVVRITRLRLQVIPWVIRSRIPLVHLSISSSS